MERTGDTAPTQAQLDAFDAVLAAWARRNPFGRLTITANGGRVKDLHDESRVHLATAEKPSSALLRMLPGTTPPGPPAGPHNRL